MFFCLVMCVRDRELVLSNSPSGVQMVRSLVYISLWYRHVAGEAVGSVL